MNTFLKEFGKWFLVLLGLFIASIIFTATTGKNKSEIVWMLFLAPIMYFPSYMGALIPAFILTLNNINNKKRSIYIVVLLMCLLGIFIPYLIFRSPGDDELELYSFIQKLPFIVIGLKTIHYWYQEWKESW
ncbi:hypothetical protein [Adhaeribacter terreus]|uniref:Uncharacterized protein n=1 Tax=Adhaeribacter terreus TaxID=529703 RepID=A0ABW0EC16_9BACT